MVAEESTTRQRSNDDVIPVTESTSHVRSSLQLGSAAQLAPSSMSSSTSSLMNDSCSNLPQVLLDKVNTNNYQNVEANALASKQKALTIDKYIPLFKSF
jgi:hypothetical protein